MRCQAVSRVVLLVCVATLWPAGRAAAQTAAQTLDPASASKWREDLQVMARNLPVRHKNAFANITRTDFERSVRDLDARLETMTPQQAFVELAAIVASVGDGHTRLTKNSIEGYPLRQYPLGLYIYRDGLFVQSAPAELRQVLGARVVKIGTLAADEAIRAASRIVTHDNPMTLRQRLPAMLTSPEALSGLGIIRDMEQAPFVFQKGDATIEVALTPIPPGSQADWLDARQSGTPPPLWLKAPRDNYWFEYLPDSRVLYVQYNAVADKKDESIAAFADRVFALAAGRPIDHFVLDVRRNGGGDDSLNLPILHGLIRSDKINQPGKLFVIIGRGTFSAAVSLAADLATHTHAIFVGEPTGGRPNYFGRVGNPPPITLPNSRLVLTYSNEWMQRAAAGDTSPWKAPRVAAEMTSDDYKAGRDPALDAVLTYTPVRPLEDTMVELWVKQGKDAALAHYRSFAADPVNTYADTIWSLRLAGRRLLNVHKRSSDAIEVFRLNVTEHPDAADPWIVLGEALQQAGDLEQARACYRRALALQPTSWELADRLAGLAATAPR